MLTAQPLSSNPRLRFNNILSIIPLYGNQIFGQGAIVSGYKYFCGILLGGTIDKTLFVMQEKLGTELK